MANRFPVVRKDGQNVQIPAGDGLLLRGPLNESPRVAITSVVSNILQIDTLAANTLTLSTSPIIDGISAMPDGIRRVIEFSGSPIIRPSPNFIAPTGAQIQVAPGDSIECLSHGFGIWQIIRYTKADGTALVGTPDNTKLQKAGGTMTGPLNLAYGTTTLSTSTGVLTWDGNGNSAFVSGSAGDQISIISDPSVTAPGAERLMVFSSPGMILVHNNRLVLPTQADITVRNGDVVAIRADSPTNWRVISYLRGDGTSLVGAPDATKLPLAGGKMTGVINDANIQTVSTQTSGDVDVSTITSQTVRITGTGPVSTLTNAPSGSGLELRVIFADDGIVVRHGGGNILLPGSANITSKQGDSMVLLQTTSPGIWRCVDYQRADGTALVSSSSGPANTDALPEGTTNLYYTDARAKAANTDKVLTSLVGAANGVAPLGSDSKIASAYLPSYVDDVLEFANLAAFPAIGESGKIYVALDTNREYRWSGSTYIQLVASPGTTDNVPEGTTNQYFTAARVLSTVLAGLSLVTGTAVVSTDSILVAIGKLQAQSTAQDTAISGKEQTIAPGTSAQYWNGLKVFTDFATSVRAAVLTGLSTATGTAVAAADSVLVAIGKLQAQITGVQASLTGQAYIEGLIPVWNSATSITLGTGSAYIPGLGKNEVVSTALTLSSLSLTANTWYYLYLYENAGAAAIELVTTAPSAPYRGTARTKSGDTSRRFVGAFKTRASSGSLISFVYSNDGSIAYTDVDVVNSLANGLAITQTTVSLSTYVPSTTKTCGVNVTNATATQNLYVGIPNFYYAMRFVAAGSRAWLSTVTDDTQNVTYQYPSSPGSNGAYIVVTNYGNDR